MKRAILISVALLVGIMTCSAGMSKSRIRKEARFLTDKMAYELNLTTLQYNDVYEINYDFIYDVNEYMDEVIRGYEWALDNYYYYLDLRNDDLRWVLSARQYDAMMDIDYFYRPIYVRDNKWSFRIHLRYTNFNFFYFDKPYHYKTYIGGHARPSWHAPSYYKGRHHGIHHKPAPIPIRKNEVTYRSSRKDDFGSINIRPNSDKRPEDKKDNVRRSLSSSSRVSSSSKNSDDMYVTPVRKESSSSRSRTNATTTTNEKVKSDVDTSRSNSRRATTSSDSRSTKSSGVKSNSRSSNSSSKSTEVKSNSRSTRSNSSSTRSSSSSSSSSRSSSSSSRSSRR